MELRDRTPGKYRSASQESEPSFLRPHPFQLAPRNAVLPLSPGSGTTAEWAEVVFDPSPPCRFPSLLLPSYGSVIFFFTLAFNKDIS